MNENKKIALSMSVIFILTAVMCAGIFRLAGNENIVGACVGLIIPSDSNDSTYEKISLNTKNALLFGTGSSIDENDSKDKVDINSLAYVPEDIKLLQENMEKVFSKEKVGGTIESKTYGLDSANLSLGDILVRNTTGRNLDISSVLSEKPEIHKAEDGDISVLIFHTHTSECYQILDKKNYLESFSPRTEDKSQNMVRVGNEIVTALEKAGIGVIHDTTIYDYEYTGAYERSGEAVDKYLKKYPTIQVVIDVHRDAIQTSKNTKVKPVTTINGKKAAQIMTITGCEGGDITDFPDWQYNLRFAMLLQKTAEEMYPTLMRPLFFCNRRYNMYKSKNSVLLEMGSDANTLDEAAYSGRLIGDVLAEMLVDYLK